IKEPEFLDDARQRRGGRHEHLLHAPLQRRLLLQLVAQLAAGELFHCDLAAALGGYELGELLDAPARWMVGVVQMPEPDRPLLDVLGLHERGRSKQRETAGQLEKCRCHESPSFALGMAGAWPYLIIHRSSCTISERR